jgi:hypothetical protein
VGWSDLFGGIVTHVCGVPGFLEGHEEWAGLASPESEAWAEMFEAWGDTFGDRAVTAADVLGLLERIEGFDWWGLEIDPTKERSGILRSLGRRLTSFRNRVHGGQRLHFVGKRDKASLYRLVPTSGGGP